MQSSAELGNTFSRAWELLTRNWIMIVPGLVIGIVAALIVFMLGAVGLVSAAGANAVGMAGAGLAAAFVSAMIIGAVLMVATILVIAYTTGMAGAAWRTGTATLDDGAAAFRTSGGQVLMAVVLLFAVGMVAVILTPFTLGLALLAFYLFFIYTLPAVIIGGRGAGEALGESARIAAKNFLSTLAVIVLLAIAFIVAAWLTRFFDWLPLLGAIIRQVITQAVAAYATLVIVGEYIKLRSSIDAVGVGVPPAASPPPSA